MSASISATDFRRRLARNPKLRLIDVRTPAEFRELHVAGAINKPLDRLKPDEFAGGEGELFVICRSGSRGAMAQERLIAAGVVDVVNVEGGTLACAEVGVEVRRGKKTMSLERQVRIAAGSLVVLGVTLSWVHPAWIGLSAFVGAGLVFAGLTDTCGMGMLIARMPWNQASATNESSGGTKLAAGEACSRPGT